MIKAKKIDFIFPEDIEQCIHDVISVWLHEIDVEKDEKIISVLKQKIMELQQVTNRTGNPHIHFHDGNHKYERVKFV